MTGTPAQVITWMMARLQTHPNAVFEVTLKKEKRTRSQNAYYWVLLSKVAQKLGTPATVLHNRMLRDYPCPFVIAGKTAKTLLPDTDETEAKVLRLETVHLKPTSQTTTLADGIRYRTYVLLRGSHEMTTDEMSWLLEGMVQEAKQQGIETMTPDELARLRAYELQKQTKQSN